jgi:DNA-binding MarR family transcriptional regulator
MIDPMVQHLLERAIDSPVKLHLLLVFYENPRLEATPRAIADRICRDIWSVSEALAELAEDGVMVHAATASGDPVYRYEPGREHLEAIERLIHGYNDPIERDQLHRSLREVAAYAPYRRANAWNAQVA